MEPCNEEQRSFVVDILALVKALKRLMKDPQKKQGSDLYLAALREATGDPDLTITPEQRKRLKTLLYAYVYSNDV